MPRLFGTDGVRGKANSELTPELAYKLGRAATIYFGREHIEDTNSKVSPTILIGRDTRVSGEMLEAALIAGICSAGGRAIVAGIIPTPAVAYLSRKLKTKAGIVISASHNPFYDNGIKFFGGDGYKLPDAVEDEIETIVQKISTKDDFPRPTGDNLCHVERRHNLLEDYVNFVLQTTDQRLDGMKIVLDCANGAAYEAMPEILQRLGANVITLGTNPNGININDNCGSTHIKNLQKAVIENHADIGIAHDGDADRCLCVDEEGKIIDGDHILVICATAMMKAGKLPNNTVVTTVMANIGFRQAIKGLGGKFEITKVGDRYVLENMLKNGYTLGGEQSGHIIFTEHSTTGDGLITALQVLSAIKRTTKKASELNALMTTYPQVLLNVKVKDKTAYEKEIVQKTIRDAELQLGENGRILVRASGTEPLIRVMAEGPNQEQLEKLCKNIVNVIESSQ